MTKINMYVLKREIDACYMDAFCISGHGSVVRTPENSNCFNILYKLEMGTVSFRQIDTFLDSITQLFPKGAVESISANIHLRSKHNSISVVVKTDILKMGKLL